MLGGSFVALNKAEEMTEKHGPEYLGGRLNTLIAKGAILQFKKYIRDSGAKLYANAGAALARVAKGETALQAVANEAFIAAVHYYFDNYAQYNEFIRGTLPVIGTVVGGAAGTLVGLPWIGSSIGAAGGSGVSYLMSKAFFETIQEDIDVTDLGHTAERLRGRLVEIVQSLPEVVSTVSSTAWYLIPSILGLTDFLSQLYQNYEKQMIEK